MTALDKDFQRKSMGTNGPVIARGIKCPVAASTTIYKGALVAINASGYAQAAAAAAGLRIVGVAEDAADNSAGSAGDVSVIPLRGAYFFANSSTTAAVTDGDVGRLCYAADDNTVARHDALGTRPVAGKVLGIESGLVLVEVGMLGDGEGEDILVLAGADLSARLHLPVKLDTAGAAVAATSAGEFAVGVQQNAPANGAVCIVRVHGKSRIILGATLTPGARIAVAATSGRAKAAVAGSGDPLAGSNCFGVLLVGGGDGDTGVCIISQMGAIPTTAA